MGEEVDEEWPVQVFAQLVENKPVIKEVKEGSENLSNMIRSKEVDKISLYKLHWRYNTKPLTRKIYKSGLIKLSFLL